MKIKNTFSSGFTLIELLVVIAIIGVLSSVVLSSLNTARGKGQNSSIKSNLANARPQGELYYIANGESYLNSVAGTNICTNGGTAIDGTTKNVYSFFRAAHDQSGATNISTLSTSVGSITQSVCHVTTAPPWAWAAAVPLKVPETSGGSCSSATPCLYFCVDSTGFSGSRVNPVIGSGAYQYACPAT